MCRTSNKLSVLVFLVGVFAITGGGSGLVMAGTNSWTGNGPFGGFVRALSFDPLHPETIYAGTGGAGIYKTTDGGESWTEINDGLLSPVVNLHTKSFAIDPKDTNTLYAGFAGGLYKSTNAGGNWVRIDDGFGYEIAVAVDPVDPNVLFVTSCSGIYKSTDTGESWSELLSPFRACAKPVVETGELCSLAFEFIPGVSSHLYCLDAIWAKIVPI